jgi:hypothetical protein
VAATARRHELKRWAANRCSLCGALFVLGTMLHFTSIVRKYPSANAKKPKMEQRAYERAGGFSSQEG